MNIYSISIYIFACLVSYNLWNLVESTTSDGEEVSSTVTSTTLSSSSVYSTSASGSESIEHTSVSQSGDGTSRAVSLETSYVAASEEPHSSNDDPQPGPSSAVSTEQVNEPSTSASNDDYEKGKREATKLVINNLKDKLTKLLVDFVSVDLNDPNVNLDDITSKLDKDIFSLSVEKTKLNEISHPDDMMYYSGFPDGWHTRATGALIKLINEYENDTSYYTGFPDGWHTRASEKLIKGMDELENDQMYYNGFPDGWHTRATGELLKLIREYENDTIYYTGFPDGWHKRDDYELLKQIRKKELREKISSVTDRKTVLEGQIKSLKEQLSFLQNEFDEADKVHKDLNSKLESLEAPSIFAKTSFSASSSTAPSVPSTSSSLVSSTSSNGTKPDEIKLFTGDINNPLEMMSSLYNLSVSGRDYTFDFNGTVKCVKVTCSNKDVWKKGDQGMDEPKFVIYNNFSNRISLKDDKNIVTFKLEFDGNWKHFNTEPRTTLSGSSSSENGLRGSTVFV